jgi:hypothetical protein
MPEVNIRNCKQSSHPDAVPGTFFFKNPDRISKSCQGASSYLNNRGANSDR